MHWSYCRNCPLEHWIAFLSPSRFVIPCHFVLFVQVEVAFQWKLADSTTTRCHITTVLLTGLGEAGALWPESLHMGASKLLAARLRLIVPIATPSVS